ncbi:MAG: dihydroneopterin aldolase [Chitinophagaceae bacterium]|nr:MAG: dihydroneopterin aldolase [Chitinophagaceae bacterium]
MVVIKLDQVKLHAFHGVYSGEPLVGGDFEVNLEVEYDDAGIAFDALQDTISYVSLFDLVNSRMKVPTPLLEKVGKLILDDVFDMFPFIKSSRISIFKLQAPIPNFQGRVGISLNRVY